VKTEAKSVNRKGKKVHCRSIDKGRRGSWRLDQQGEVIVREKRGMFQKDKAKRE